MQYIGQAFGLLQAGSRGSAVSAVSSSSDSKGVEMLTCSPAASNILRQTTAQASATFPP
ncbi:MAG TPA: hypothetical protein VGD05_03410 [Pyrinomonadaceae bacterium]|jgi:hypothetical protein